MTPIEKRNRSRSRARLWLTLAAIPFALVIVVFAGKLMSLSVITDDAIGQYDSGLFEASAETSDGLVENSIVEPWIPYFNRADAIAATGDFTGAIDDFEIALELAPDDRKCPVVLNLAHSWELLGDVYEQSGYHQGAVQLYELGRQVLVDNADYCENTPNEDEADQQGQDLTDKQADAEQNREAEDAGEPEADAQQRLDELDQKQQQGAQERQNDDARDRGEEGPGSSTARPW
jgi:tetratricopeptide (TPR) repeat protein